MTYSDIVTCVKLFLEFDGRSANETEEGKHFWHYQPPSSDPPQRNQRFHIVIDIDKAEHSGPLQEGFPHEIYRVSHIEEEM